jgi:hypothetical protein
VPTTGQYTGSDGNVINCTHVSDAQQGVDSGTNMVEFDQVISESVVPEQGTPLLIGAGRCFWAV